MKKIYPDFYENFKCIADRCPDSCCKDWDVVVDDKSAEVYSCVCGECGKKLNEKMIIDEDGDRIFKSDNGKCPFWNDDMLCDIYINLGEEMLCKTCREFPRLTQDYTAFSEYMLSFSCPEAAKIMLALEKFDYIEDFKIENTELDYDLELMNFIIKARKITSDIIADRQKLISERLKKALIFNAQVQNLINNEVYDISMLNDLKSCDFSGLSEQKKDCSFIFEMHKSMDIMNEDFYKELCNTEIQSEYLADKYFEKALEILSQYYLFRYYLNAIDTYDVTFTIKRLICAVIVISALCVSKKTDENRLVQIFQQYSKEVEHSYENVELMEEKFFTDNNFSIENLIYALN